ncbi:hypothetical protein MIT9_P2364 [Methylomarinovum caldicuralii]|uniref:DUF86 domain-containing protein n=1 Tax=Methylomarinovum caldicuralii TaxID=438856 RepID=A0AAU9CS22_9GAMM|nr:HepT-like ribonuclease domain-containing protein [Methylomarinovum caldicuralii]BCX82778.1 hypothetical protein MIT9_P2364 [Methylomarinovum caldicuralii]
MLDAGHRACQLSRDKRISELEPDSETALALTRLLEIIGEAAKQISPQTQSLDPQIPWRDIADTRNRIIHEYFDVDFTIIETIIVQDLPVLLPRLENLLHLLQKSDTTF